MNTMTNTIELIPLGTGTAVPSLDRSSSACLLRVSGLNVLIDCGGGTVRRLLEAGVTYHDIDLLLLTHLHPDHTADLVPLLFACRYHTDPRVRALTLVGGQGTEKFLGQLDATFGRHLFSSYYDLTITEVARKNWQWNDIAFTASPVRHIPGSLAYSIEFEGKKVSFSGDTGYCTELIELARDSDLFVCECALPDRENPDSHLSPSLAGKIAAEAGVSRLVLIHFYPEVESEPIYDLVRREFSGQIILGQDLMRIEI